MIESTVFTVPPPEGKTRLCLDPWAKVFIRADGSVDLCCHAAYVGDLNTQSLQEIVDGEEAAKYRQGLLTGKLMPVCKVCPDRRIARTEELERAVVQYLELGVMDIY